MRAAQDDMAGPPAAVPVAIDVARHQPTREDVDVSIPETPAATAIEVRGLTAHYGPKLAVSDVSLDARQRSITAIIGPSGSGKSTVLRAMNRMLEVIPGARVEGTVRFHGVDIYDREIEPAAVRRTIGMVFQQPNPVPTMSIYDNVAAGLRLNGLRGDHGQLVERCLRRAALWDEVKDRLKHSALSLSGGQQQRLCIARALAVEPDVLLMDEPASALDPIATAKIEELIHELKRRYTIVTVTHNMQQAARVSDRTAFFYLGELVEVGPTEQIFTNPREQRTEDYLTGKFG
jgi:phosphate transport system ATP-binding protein